MSKEAQILLKEIQYKTGMTLEEIADKIGYSRPYLNNVKLKGGGGKIIGILKEKFKDILQNVPLASSTPPADYNPITNNSQHIAGRGSLPQGTRQITLDDYIALLESQNEKLNKVIEANLTVLLQICSDTHETGNAILDYQKSWVEFVARKESGGVGNKKYKELKKLWDSALTSLLKGDLHKDSTAVQDT